MPVSARGCLFAGQRAVFRADGAFAVFFCFVGEDSAVKPFFFGRKTVLLQTKTTALSI